MTHKRQREYRKLIEGEGVEVVRIEPTGSGHYKYWCRVNDRAFAYVCPASGSDRRHMLNVRSEIRRLMREATR